MAGREAKASEAQKKDKGSVEEVRGYQLHSWITLPAKLLALMLCQFKKALEYLGGVAGKVGLAEGQRRISLKHSA